MQLVVMRSTEDCCDIVEVQCEFDEEDREDKPDKIQDAKVFENGFESGKNESASELLDFGATTHSRYVKPVANRSLEVSAQRFCVPRSTIFFTLAQPAMLDVKSMIPK